MADLRLVPPLPPPDVRRLLRRMRLANLAAALLTGLAIALSRRE